MFINVPVAANTRHLQYLQQKKSARMNSPSRIQLKCDGTSDAGGKWRGNWRMEWVASTLHTTSEHGVSSITTADAHTSVASIRRSWPSRPFIWTRPFCRKTKSGFCVCHHISSSLYKWQGPDGLKGDQTMFLYFPLVSDAIREWWYLRPAAILLTTVSAMFPYF